MENMQTMIDFWYLFILLPVAFIHGWWTGNNIGLRNGANSMYDILCLSGKEIPGKDNVVMVELELDKSVLLSKSKRRL